MSLLMDRLLLSFLFLSSLCVSAQQIVPFQDYASCLTGFRADGRQVHPAVFELAGKQSRWEKYNSNGDYWLVQQNGLQGILSLTGEQLLPCIYDDVLPGPKKTFIVRLKGKSGIVSETNEVILPCTYDGLRADRNGSYIYGENGLYGLMDSTFRIVTPPVYTNLYRCEMPSYSEGSRPASNRYYVASHDGLLGVVDRDKGAIFPPEYSYIDAIWADQHCLESNACFQVYNGELTGIVNSEGLLVVPLQAYFSVQTGSSLFAPCGEATMTAVVRERVHSPDVAYNLLTGDHSAPHATIFAWQNYLVYTDDDGWGLLNAAMQPFFHSTDYVPGISFSGGPMREHHFGHLFSMHPERSTLQTTDSVVYLVKTVKEPESYYDRPLCKTGLVDVYSGKTLPCKYDQIRVLRSGGKRYYWAVTMRQNEDEDAVPESIDIYGSDMKKRYAIPVAGIEWPNYIEQPGWYVIQRSNGKYGLVGADGNVRVPFVHTSFYYLNAGWWQRNKRDLLVFGSKGGKGVFDTLGNVLIPMDYDTISLQLQPIISAVKDGLTDLYKSDFSLLADRCSHASNGALMDRDNHYLLTQDPATQLAMHTPTIYIVKDSFLFFLENDRFVKADSTRFNFFGDRALVSSFYTIRKDGFVTSIDPNGRPIEQKVRDVIPAQRRYNVAQNYWIRETYGNNRLAPWYLYDSLQQHKVLPDAFDYPLLGWDNQHIFRRSGKYGLLGYTDSIVVPAVYDHIFSSANCYLLLRDGKWGIYTRDTLIAPQFDSVSTEAYKTGRFVFAGGNAGFLGNDLRWIIPLMPVAEMIGKYDLVQVTGHVPDAAYTYERRGIVYNPANKALYRKINNEHLFEQARLRSTAHQFLEVNEMPPWPPKTQVPLPPMAFVLNDRREEVEFIPGYFSAAYYSELVRFSAVSWGSYAPTRKELRDPGNSWYTTFSYNNYRIVNNELVPIGLYDVIRPEAEAQLDALLTEELTRVQSFGLTCQNIPEYLIGLKKRFTLTPEGIRFYGDPERRESFIVNAYFYKMKGMLKDPSMQSRY